MKIKVYNIIEKVTKKGEPIQVKVIKAEDFLNAIKDVEKEIEEGTELSREMIDEVKKSREDKFSALAIFSLGLLRGQQKAKSIISKLKENVGNGK